MSAWQAARATTAEAQANANEQKAVANAVTAQEKEQEAIKQRDEVKALADKLVAKDQQLQRTLYAAHMNLAHNAFEAGAPSRLKELLAQHRPQPGEADLRGFEWHYLNRLFPADLLVLKHTAAFIAWPIARMASVWQLYRLKADGQTTPCSCGTPKRARSSLRERLEVS